MKNNIHRNSILSTFSAVGFFVLVLGSTSAVAQSAQPLSEADLQKLRESSAVSKALKKESETEKEQVVTGVIASTVGQGRSGAVAVETTGSSPGDEKNAITGSVSNLGRNCSAQLMNSSKINSYRVRFTAIGENERGVRVLRKNFSATIAPEGKVSREFSCKADYSMKLELVSAQAVSSR